MAASACYFRPDFGLSTSRTVVLGWLFAYRSVTYLPLPALRKFTSGLGAGGRLLVAIVNLS